MNSEKIAVWKEDYMRYCKAANLAGSTVEVYWNSVVCFIWKHNTVSLDRFTWKQIADYILSNYDNSRTIAQKRYSIQLFYAVCFNQKDKLMKMPTPKKERVLPQVLSIQECSDIFAAIDNLKHKAFIQLAYACALRISELEGIKIKHIDGKAKTLFIEQSKGAKDRVVPIPEETLVLLRQYFKLYIGNNYSGESYLFTGQSKTHTSYSQASIRAVLKRAAIKAMILKKIKFHTLRHSRATHWYNAGLQIRDIALLLGHSNLSTTEIYIHTGLEDLQAKLSSVNELISLKAESYQKQKLQKQLTS